MIIIVIYIVGLIIAWFISAYFYSKNENKTDEFPYIAATFAWPATLSIIIICGVADAIYWVFNSTSKKFKKWFS